MLLVTGITGHSGIFFLQELINNKYEDKIRCIIRESSDVSLLDKSGLNIEKVVGDLNNQEFIDKAMIGVDTILHIASIYYSVKIIKAAVKYDVKRVIFVHTTGIYSKYKKASEEYKNIESELDKIIKDNKSSVGLIYLRPTMIYGNIGDRNIIKFIKMVDKLRLLPIINHGDNLLQPVNGRDLGKAYYQILMKTDIKSGDYILSGNSPISMLNLFKLISKELGKKTMYINIPLGLGVFMARFLKLITFGKLNYIEKVQRMGEDRNFPYDLAAKDFGYSPMLFSDGLKIEIEQYKNCP